MEIPVSAPRSVNHPRIGVHIDKQIRNLMCEQISDSHRDLAGALLDHIRRSKAPHYRDAGLEELATRCRRLLDELVQAIRSDPGRLGGYVARIAEERIAEGFPLDEVQMALTFFEQEVWRLCDQRIASRQDLLKALSLVTWIIGHAKDELARTFLRHKQRSAVDVARLEQRLEDLFKGTDSLPLIDDEN